MGLISRRVFPILQLARMALVFTAISNSLCALMLSIELRDGPGHLLKHLPVKEAVVVALMSTGLYGFGMTLNDIIDRRRDSQLAAHRPLPSGRVGVGTAQIIAWLLIALALSRGRAIFALVGPGMDAGDSRRVDGAAHRLL